LFKCSIFSRLFHVCTVVIHLPVTFRKQAQAVFEKLSTLLALTLFKYTNLP
jgi:hypothetical protein